MRPVVVAFVMCAACGDERGAAPSPKPVEPASAPPPAATVERATAEECERALATLKTLMPDDVPGDEEDRRDCLAMPRAVVLCMTSAKTAAEADACVVKHAPVPAVAQKPAEPAPLEPRASADACQKAMAHVKELVPGWKDDPAQAARACAEQATVPEVECLLAAKTAEDLDACGQP